jgi:hypothetical protein
MFDDQHDIFCMTQRLSFDRRGHQRRLYNMVSNRRAVNSDGDDVYCLTESVRAAHHDGRILWNEKPSGSNADAMAWGFAGHDPQYGYGGTLRTVEELMEGTSGLDAIGATRGDVYGNPPNRGVGEELFEEDEHFDGRGKAGPQRTAVYPNASEDGEELDLPGQHYTSREFANTYALEEDQALEDDQNSEANLRKLGIARDYPGGVRHPDDETLDTLYNSAVSNRASNAYESKTDNEFIGQTSHSHKLLVANHRRAQAIERAAYLQRLRKFEQAIEPHLTNNYSDLPPDLQAMYGAM